MCASAAERGLRAEVLLRAAEANAAAGPVARAVTEVYECQRSYLFGGWSNKLMPTDRGNWVTRDNRESFNTRSSIQPRPHWHWVDDWKVDRALEPCDRDGWRYAVDFGSTYYPADSPLLFVRRRRWIRTQEGPA